MRILIMITFALMISMNTLAQDQESRLTKGKGFVGLSFGASFKDANNTDVLGLYKVLSENHNGGNVDFNGGYFFGNYFAVGASVIYDRSNKGLVTESSDGIRTVSDVVDASLTTGIYVKYFTPLNEKERINLFAKLGVSYTGGRSLEEATTSNILTRTFQTYDKINLGIIPGVQVLVAKGFAVEADISIAGLETSWNKSYVNGEPAADSKSTDINFAINLLSLNIGFYYYF